MKLWYDRSIELDKNISQKKACEISQAFVFKSQLPKSDTDGWVEGFEIFRGDDTNSN